MSEQVEQIKLGIAKILVEAQAGARDERMLTGEWTPQKANYLNQQGMARLTRAGEDLFQVINGANSADINAAFSYFNASQIFTVFEGISSEKMHGPEAEPLQVAAYNYFFPHLEITSVNDIWDKFGIRAGWDIPGVVSCERQQEVKDLLENGTFSSHNLAHPKDTFEYDLILDYVNYGSIKGFYPVLFEEAFQLLENADTKHSVRARAQAAKLLEISAKALPNNDFDPEEDPEKQNQHVIAMVECARDFVPDEEMAAQLSEIYERLHVLDDVHKRMLRHPSRYAAEVFDELNDQLVRDLRQTSPDILDNRAFNPEN